MMTLVFFLEEPSAEEMLNGILTKNSYQKVFGSRAISKHLDLENNRSHSFNVLVKAIRYVVSEGC